MFIDAIPAIIILGTVLWPVAEFAGLHPIHFAIIGVISLAFGLVTPPYGLCLLIACSIGDIKLGKALKDVAIILLPMLGVLLIVLLALGAGREQARIVLSVLPFYAALPRARRPLPSEESTT